MSKQSNRPDPAAFWIGIAAIGIVACFGGVYIFW